MDDAGWPDAGENGFQVGTGNWKLGIGKNFKNLAPNSWFLVPNYISITTGITIGLLCVLVYSNWPSLSRRVSLT